VDIEPIDSLYMTSNRLSIVTFALGRTVSDCSINATVSTVG